MHYDWRSARLDTLGLLPATEYNGSGPRVYGRGLEIAAGPAGLVYAADTGADSILSFSIGEGATRALPTPYRSAPVPASARTETEFRAPIGNGEDFVRTFDYPDTYPRIARLLVDDAGLLWVMAYPPRTSPMKPISALEAGTDWTVLTRAGSAVATVHLPPGLTPLEIGPDYVLGISEDELDVQSVSVYGLSRDSGDST